MGAGGLGTLSSEGTVVKPSSWDEALDARRSHPGLAPVCGGTDLMVEINFAHRRPEGLLDLSGLTELRTWEFTRDPASGSEVVRIGAGVTYTQVIRHLAGECPALALAARTVGSPQIRNRGTIAGNLATASPAGDSHPPLLAARARVEIASVDGTRLVDIDDFFLGPKQSCLGTDELIRAIHVPAATGPRQFAKIGPRNAMVIATASFAVSLDPIARRVGAAIGSAAPTPRRTVAAEGFLETQLRDRWDDASAVNDDVAAHFGRLVADAAAPIDDVRGTADYRRHALSVLARRCLSWSWTTLHRESRP